MQTSVLLVHFLGGMLLANAIPHTVHGISGHRFQTPFARPPGRGESSPLVNLLWGAVNAAAGWWLVHWQRGAGPRLPEDQHAVAAGALVVGLVLAWWFGKVRGSGGVAGDSLGRG